MQKIGPKRKKKKLAGDLGQMIECLPSKWETLSSNSSITKQKCWEKKKNYPCKKKCTYRENRCISDVCTNACAHISGEPEYFPTILGRGKPWQVVCLAYLSTANLDCYKLQCCQNKAE
jgi:hypothetical protein